MAFLRRTYLYILLVPILFTFLGAASNQLVLVANGDTFPVLVNSARTGGLEAGAHLDEIHVVMGPQHRLRALADIFDFHDATMSIGDLSLELGDWLWAFAVPIWGFAAVRKLNAHV